MHTTDTDLGGRARDLFRDHQRTIFRHTDRLFAGLMIVQWLAGVAAAYLISPAAWAGASSKTHPHVWAALLLGGVISAPPVFLALAVPGRAVTRHAVAVGQMLMGALLIHLTGGRIETHFHVFGSLAFLAFYRDWRVLVPATVVVAADHYLRGVLWPQSVYGVVSASGWRWVEHAGWVLFEDTVLFIAIKHGVREMWNMAERTAEVESLNQGLESRVAERTAQLVASNEELTKEVGERKQAEEQLLHNAFHDGLTDLANRALFMDHLNLAFGRERRHGTYQFAVLFLDLDRFKVVNDSLGHMIGDQLLVEVGRRLAAVMRPGDTVSRLGGDEFTILLDDIGEGGEAAAVAERLQGELALPFHIGGHEVYTTASIGIALSAGGYHRPEDILRDADTAMYRAKSLGKAQHQVFDSTMHARALNRLQIESDLRRALEREELHVNYQPIVSLRDGTIRGFEALARWRHPVRGLIPPSEFIPVAEETGLVTQLDRWVLRQACSQMRRWQEEFPAAGLMKISVNLSCRQFTQPDVVEQVLAVLRATGMDARSLKLEITESVMMENGDHAMRVLERLRGAGVELSLDDFGTGYSSLSYIHSFPVSTLKIDRSFIKRIGGDGDGGEIVRTVVALARNLGLEVVAEGVETRAQLDRLRALDCGQAQGYLFSVPLGAEAAAELLRGEALGELLGAVEQSPDDVAPADDSHHELLTAPVRL